MSNITITSDSTIDSTIDSDAVIDAVIDGYLAAWNTVDADQRAAIVERVWAPDARMVDPLVDVAGHAELAAVFARFHETYPGCSFRRTGDHDHHHDLVRWSWEMVDADGNPVLAGLDVALLAADRRLAYVAGFFG